MTSCSLDISREKMPTGMPPPLKGRVLGNVEAKEVLPMLGLPATMMRSDG